VDICAGAASPTSERYSTYAKTMRLTGSENDTCPCAYPQAVVRPSPAQVAARILGLTGPYGGGRVTPDKVAACPFRII
jgi:hypothetical protein